MRKIILLLFVFCILAACRQSQPGQSASQKKAAASGAQLICRDNEQAGESEIYVKDSGSERLLTKVTGIFFDHYHYTESHGSTLFIIRRTGDLVEWTEWTDELWRFDADRSEGKMVFAAQGLDFRASPDAQRIAVTTNEKLTIIDGAGSILKEYSAVDFTSQNPLSTGAFEPRGWSDDSRLFWLSMAEEGNPSVICSLECASWKLSIYSTEGIGIESEYEINLNNGKLAVSDYPFLFDADDENELIESKKKITLFVYDLASGSREQIATSEAKPFNPEWKEGNKLEFDSPDDKGRKTVAVQ